MKRALVFPGQGSQRVGMGKALCAAFPEAREVFQEVDEALDFRLTKIVFEGPEEELTLTENTQPALMAVSMAVMRVLERQGGFQLPEAAAFAAGHSLGEYSALCAAGAFGIGDAARLLRLRGQAMRRAAPPGSGAMAALLGADLQAAREIAAAAAQGEVCIAANDNAPGQVVISGHAAAIDRAIAIAAERGFKRCVKLPVSAPFHSPLMEPAAREMREALAATAIACPCVPVVSNVTASAVSDPETIRGLLVEQVTGSVRWRESVLFLKEQEVEQIVECGAGSVLAGLAKRIDRDMNAVSLHTPEEIEKFLAGM